MDKSYHSRKQSASVMINILGVLILALVMVGISVALVKIFNVTNIIIILTVVLILFLIILFVLIKVLDNIGSKRFNKYYRQVTSEVHNKYWMYLGVVFLYL